MRKEKFEGLLDDERIFKAKPSKFYPWLWKAYSSGKLTVIERAELAKKYESINPQTTIDEDINDVFGPQVDITIREPIWATKSIGVNEDKLRDTTRIEITYRDKDGVRLYPHTYKINKMKALAFPSKRARGVKLRIIPISELEIEEGA